MDDTGQRELASEIVKAIEAVLKAENGIKALKLIEPMVPVRIGSLSEALRLKEQGDAFTAVRGRATMVLDGAHLRIGRDLGPRLRRLLLEDVWIDLPTDAANGATMTVGWHRSHAGWQLKLYTGDGEAHARPSACSPDSVDVTLIYGV